MKYEQVCNLTDIKFKRIVGIKHSTFKRLVEKLRIIQQTKHNKGGRNPKLSIENILMATLEYLREYRTFAHIAISFGIDESNIYRAVIWCENELIKLDELSLPGLKTLKEKKYSTVTVDVTECVIERPKKNQKDYYSGKKNDTP
jgi:hypothetical protein